jgi:hypothetical protein
VSCGVVYKTFNTVYSDQAMGLRSEELYFDSRQ